MDGKPRTSPKSVKFLFGGLAGMGATVFVQPLDLVKNRIPRRFGFNPIRDIQVLCPMQRGGVGARSLNVDLQKALNPGSGEERSRGRYAVLGQGRREGKRVHSSGAARGGGD